MEQGAVHEQLNHRLYDPFASDVHGNSIGAGLGRAAATVAGPVAGGIGGNALEHRLTRENGEEVVVRLDSGRTVAITQGGHDLEAGQRVRVLTGLNGSRVERG